MVATATIQTKNQTAMKNKRNIALGVKKYLVNLTIQNRLPQDMNDLNVDTLASIIEDANKRNKVSEYDLAIEKARDYLSANSDLSDDDYEGAEMQVALIVAQAKIDGTMLIDYIDEVVVWEKMELEFTCDEFLSEIGYVEK